LGGGEPGAAGDVFGVYVVLKGGRVEMGGFIDESCVMEGNDFVVFSVVDEEGVIGVELDGMELNASFFEKFSL
jgi:hypothetical protein